MAVHLSTEHAVSRLPTRRASSGGVLLTCWRVHLLVPLASLGPSVIVFCVLFSNRITTAKRHQLSGINCNCRSQPPPRSPSASV